MFNEIQTCKSKKIVNNLYSLELMIFLMISQRFVFDLSSIMHIDSRVFQAIEE